MKILLHSSKTMKPESSSVHELSKPRFVAEATRLNDMLRHLTRDDLVNLMEINGALADKVIEHIRVWDDQTRGSAAALTFRGDIYSGLAATSWDEGDADFAQKHLLILSGLYGLLRPFDEIKAYRLEMGYKLRTDDNLTLEEFWEKHLADALDANDSYINLTAMEYFNAIKKQLADSTVISPKFLTVGVKTNMPVFVTVHAKIARGSFAGWLIKNKITDPNEITGYNELNYAYDERRSTASEPVFVCQTFGGLGLSVRLR